MIKRQDLQHGDVLLFVRHKHSSLLVKMIRLITGSQFTHAAIVLEVDQKKFVLEQENERMHSYLPFYYAFKDEEIYAYRPKFPIPNIVFQEFNRLDYGYLCIIDCAINHLLGLFNSKREYKPLLTKLFKSKTVTCSALVAQVLKLTNNVNWCKYVETVEPDDFANHSETFTSLGSIDWETI